MNENVLMENPLDVFRDFAEIPDEAFEYDAQEIRGLIRTITNSEDFIEYLAETSNERPEEFAKEIQTLQAMRKMAKDGRFGDQKNKMMLMYVEDVLDTIDQIQQLGGAFRKVVVPIYRVSEDAILPKYATVGSSGMDVYTPVHVRLEPGELKVIPTGLKVAVPGGYNLKGVPKSGISSKTHVRMANSPGTIDSDYRGEIGIILENLGDEPVEFTKGSKLIQLILEKIPHIEWNEMTEEEWAKFTNTERGEGGYGSTGA